MISEAHAQALLEGRDDAELVVVEGRAHVVSADSLEREPYRGALRIVSRPDLAGPLGDIRSLSADTLAEVAGRLDATATRLGA
ncbi:hypothetical protein ACFV3R_12035 [Streptomyces sp. NPDC059740]|uniref:hypothetical protein n=1 Tax=Streptomyces sp. NPDC059740 TaxID=3346926 RepID=UPI003667B5A9